MFTIIGSAIGIFTGLVTVITNAEAFASLSGLFLLLTFLIVMFAYISLGAFFGMAIDIVMNKYNK